jgi:hypothetical protein
MAEIESQLHSDSISSSAGSKEAPTLARMRAPCGDDRIFDKHGRELGVGDVDRIHPPASRRKC